MKVSFNHPLYSHKLDLQFNSEEKSGYSAKPLARLYCADPESILIKVCSVCHRKCCDISLMSMLEFCNALTGYKKIPISI